MTRKLQQALEGALVEDPDDLAAHMAYADYLSEQGDPRGEFIQVQLALEDEKRPAAERKKLRRREEELLQEHARAWLGEELAAFLLDGREDDLAEGGREDEEGPRGEFTFSRGWLDYLEIGLLSDEFARVVARAPAVRLLRRLHVGDVYWEGEAPLATLGKGRHLRNVRALTVEGGWGFDADAIVTRLPRLEELYLLASHTYPAPIFRCRKLKHLRVLTVESFTETDIDALASNPALANLTHLSLHPHAMDEEDRRPYLRLEHLRALVRSRHLRSLTSLTLRLCDAGDAGCQEIIDSGALKRLRELDLGPGCITDEGARALAACPDLKNLRRLDLSGNRLTPAGIRALKKTGVPLVAGNQQAPDDNGEYDDSYLYEGDSE